jgi:hypothetical protein
MEAKLKSLKVPELKDILLKAAEPPPAKAAKADLIARILASEKAVAAYNTKFAPKDDLLAPPEECALHSLFFPVPTNIAAWTGMSTSQPSQKHLRRLFRSHQPLRPLL